MNNKKKSSTKGKIDKKYAGVVIILAGVLLVLGIMIVVRMSGCGKNVKAPVLSYEAVEGSDTDIYITGLTEKGKSQENITIPAKIEGKNVVSIGREAFRDSVNLKSVVIEEGVGQIFENAFFNCRSLENISVPASVTNIGTNAFKNTKWESIQLTSGDCVVINNILIMVNTGKATYTVPDGVKIIGSGVFYNNNVVTEVKLPESLESIGDYAFAGCTGLEEVELPMGLKEIGYAAFQGCENLVIDVPETVEKTGVDAFLGVKEVK